MKVETTVIPTLRRVCSTTYALFPTSGLNEGDLAWATDREALYRWSGAAWEAVGISSRHGLKANIGNPADYPESSLYQADDENICYMIVTGAWVAIAGAPTPSGVILMWHGTIANIPTGWRICDGGGGTPNLLGRFVEGVATAATNPGASGGATNKATAGHVHTTSNLALNISQIPSHSHRYVVSGGANAFYGFVTADITEGNAYVNKPNEPIGGGGTHGHGNTGSKTDSIADIRPKYYDIAFIMKL